MSKKILINAIGLAIMLAVTGCGNIVDSEVHTNEKIISDTAKEETEEVTENSDEAVDLLDQFAAGEIEAGYYDSDYNFKITDLNMNPEEWDAYSVGDRRDLDNDGEEELIMNGPYGGMYLDVKDGKVMVLAEGEGSAGEMTFVDYENAIWIVHSDTSHTGRMLYNFKKYKGANNIIDEFDLSAEYYDKKKDIYDETSTFTYRNQTITMEKFEKLRSEILGIE
ncbi:hypothetical protein [Anaeromicropila populeti]|uniref:Lipoprotein n=1 Tax=Anaeromicropila populeti TaxID=37658 RepID=A0A1I6KC84_9FIRM|nr:hypothetical protein [Anaeromicropila populeti]SFR88853.1 hypothetical protein SAMN05661086_02364 [Anaeromicropila populeti]